MLECLNQFGIHVACIGNHDFDFGLKKVRDFVARTTFPWVCSNIKIKAKPVIGTETITMMWNGIKIGFIGVGD
jgi:2',3'-cyclic-nucleotide 2'-phosphodiesterase (5'-nucleotidase family)